MCKGSARAFAALATPSTFSTERFRVLGFCSCFVVGHPDCITVAIWMFGGCSED